MVTNILINALGQAIFESCGQALIIYISLQIFWALFQGIGPKYRYRINYAALMVICGWFLINLVNIYLHSMRVPKISNLAYVNYMAATASHVPTLLQQAEAFISKYAGYITGLYIMGLILHAFRLLGGLVNIQYIRKQKNLSVDSIWSARAHTLAKNLDIIKKVALYFSEHVQVPLTIGHLKPIIIFPIALINNLEQEQVEAILLHELAHIKRHDYLLNIVQCIMETILCFNPFAWLLSKAIREEREYCCDDIVVDADCNNFTYAKALFIIAQKSHETYTLAMAANGTKKYPLLNRIKRLNTMKTKDSLPKFHLLVIIAIAAIGVLLAWGIPQYSVAKDAAHRAPRVIAHPLLSSGLAAPVVPTRISPKPYPIQKRKIFTVYVNNMEIGPNTIDTLKPGKSRFKIVVQDEKGDKKEFNSVEELPGPYKEEFLEENPAFGNLKVMDSLVAPMPDIVMSPEWHEQMDNLGKMGKKMQKQFNSPQWKKQQRVIEKEALAMSMQFNSKEWQKQQEDWNKHADELKKQYEDNPEWRKQQDDWKKDAEDLQKNFNNSPEWQKQQADLMKHAEEIKKQFNDSEYKKRVAELQKQAARIRKHFDSTEWRRQQEDIKKRTVELSREVERELKMQNEYMQKNAGGNSDKTDQDSTKNAN